MNLAKRAKLEGWKVGDVLLYVGYGWNTGTRYTARLTAIGEAAVLTRRKGAAEYCQSDGGAWQKVDRHMNDEQIAAFLAKQKAVSA